MKEVQTGRQRVYDVLDIAFWRLRGVLFCSSAMLSLGLGVVGEYSGSA